MGYNRPNMYSISLFCSVSSPADSTTYYLGSQSVALGSTPGLYSATVPKKGIIRACAINWSSGTIGTNEDVVFSVRVNNTTDYTLFTIGQALAFRSGTNDGLIIPVNKGDYVDIKIVTPAWVTNPDSCRLSGVLVVEAE